MFVWSENILAMLVWYVLGETW